MSAIKGRCKKRFASHLQDVSDDWLQAHCALPVVLVVARLHHYHDVQGLRLRRTDSSRTLGGPRLVPVAGVVISRYKRFLPPFIIPF